MVVRESFFLINENLLGLAKFYHLLSQPFMDLAGEIKEISFYGLCAAFTYLATFELNLPTDENPK